MWLWIFPPRGKGGVFQFSLWTLEVWKKTSRIVRVLEKQWPAYNIVSIRICSRRKWLALKSVWSWPLLASVPVVCTLYRVSFYNQTFPQQLKKLIAELQHSYKSLPDLMWQNQLGVFQVVTVGSLKHKRKNLFFLSLFTSHGHKCGSLMGEHRKRWISNLNSFSLTQITPHQPNPFSSTEPP